jgi:hypothetical protein
MNEDDYLEAQYDDQWGDDYADDDDFDYIEPFHCAECAQDFVTWNHYDNHGCEADL